MSPVAPRSGGSRWSRPTPALALALAVVVTAPVIVSACSDDEDSIPATPPVTAATTSTGDECLDPTGDLGEDVQTQGTLTEPAGVDLVSASAELTDRGLEVRFETAGPVALAPRPEFFVFQGPPALPQSFEVQASRQDDGSWAVALVTYAAGPSTRPLTVPVRAEGQVVAFTIPPGDVPPVGTVYWAFGARSADDAGVTVLDDCDPLAAASTTTPP